MTATWYYLGVVVLLSLSGLSWCASLLSLPGNWCIVVLTAVFAWLLQLPDGRGISWVTVGVLVLLSLGGEMLESLAGAAGAAKLGGSRRGMVLAVAGALLGSLAGAVVGIPIPIVGSAVAAVFGGAVGACGGAMLGEHWKGRQFDHGLKIGRAAFLGRLLGTAGKLVIGAIMWVVVAVDAIF